MTGRPCPQGHPASARRRTASGRRPCMECRRERDRRRAEERWAAHQGHAVIVTRSGRRRCATCSQGYRLSPVDESAVIRAVDGDPPARLSPADLAAAALRLTDRELSAREIALRVGCSARTVVRIRAARRAGLIGGTR